MADFGADFKSKIKSVSSITAVIGADTATRIYPDTLKHNATLPALMYKESGGGESYEKLGGALGVAETVMIVDSFAATRSAANALAEKVRNALQGPVNDTWGTTYVSSVSAVGHRQTEIDWSADKQTIKRWITRRIFRIFHDETT